MNLEGGMADQIKNVFISHVHEDDAGLAKVKEILGNKGDVYPRFIHKFQQPQ